MCGNRHRQTANMSTPLSAEQCARHRVRGTLCMLEGSMPARMSIRARGVATCNGAFVLTSAATFAAFTAYMHAY